MAVPGCLPADPAHGHIDPANPESAEDVTQEAFLKLLQHWRKVTALDQPDAWVRRVAIRLAVRHAKREARRGRSRQTPARLRHP